MANFFQDLSKGKISISIGGKSLYESDGFVDLFLDVSGLAIVQRAFDYLLPDVPEIDIDPEKGVLLNKQGNTNKIPVVYGASKVGGLVAFKGVSGSSNKNYHIVLALCEGEINSIGNIYIDDELSTLSKFSGLLNVRKYLGGVSQTVDSVLNAAFPTEWPTTSTGDSLAYVAIQATWDENNKAFRGGLRVHAELEGLKVLDLRSNRTEYSTNPAWVIYDYLTSEMYGKGYATTDLDSQSFIDAANYFDTLQSKNTNSDNNSYSLIKAFEPETTQSSNFFGYDVAIAKTISRYFVGAYTYDGAGTDRGAVYFLKENNAGSTVEIIQPTDVSDSDLVGTRNSISNDGAVLVVSNAYDDTQAVDAGSASIHEYNSVTGFYDQQIILYAVSPTTLDHYSLTNAVSGDGTTVFVGCHDYNNTAANAGAVFVYTKVSNVWTLQDTIVDALPTANEHFGWSISPGNTGDTVVIGMPHINSNQGEVQIFDRASGSYSLTATLTVGIASEWFGHNVKQSNDGAYIYVSSIKSDGAGNVYIYKKPGGGWADLTTSAGADQILIGSAAQYFGVSLGALITPYDDYAGSPVDCSTDGNTLVIGAWQKGIGILTGGGSCVVYTYNVASGLYDEYQEIRPTDIVSLDYYGWSVACNSDATQIIVGAKGREGTDVNTGMTYLYARDREICYEINGVVDTKNKVDDNKKSLLQACDSFLPFSQGKHYLIPDKLEASQYQFTKHNIVGAVARKGVTKDQKLNQVRIKYRNPLLDYQSDIAVSNSATFKAADNGLLLEKTYNFPYEISPSRAAARAEKIMKGSRETGVISFSTTFAALDLRVTDVADITMTELGWVNKLIRIIKFTTISSGTIGIIAVEHESAVYDRTIPVERPAPPNTNLPDALNIPAPTGMTVDGSEAQLFQSNAGGIVAGALIAWNDPDNVYIKETQVRYKLSTDTEYTFTSTAVGSTTLSIRVPIYADGLNYDFQIRHVTVLNAESDWATTSTLVQGRTTPPADVPTFLINVQSDGTREITWTYPSPPLDLAGFKIKYVVGTGQAYSTMSDFPGAELLPPGIRKFETNQLFGGSYTIAIVAVDTTGNESTTPSIIDATIGDPRLANAFKIVDLVVDGWTGAKTQCEVDEYSVLHATDQNTWANLTTWSAWANWYQNPYLSITYEHAAIDIGGIVTFTPIVSVSHTSDTLTITESHSDDDTTYTSFASINSAVTARYVKIKIVITDTADFIQATSATIILSGTPVTEIIEDLDVSTLAACVSAPACSTSGYKIGTGDFRVPINETYTKIKRVNLIFQGDVGFTYNVADKDVAVGPRIKTYNSSGVLTDPVNPIDIDVNGL